MKMSNMIGIGERAGSGVPDIYSVWESQGWIAPQVTEEYSPDRTILKLPFVSAEQKKGAGKGASKKVPVKSASKKVPVKSAGKKLQKKTLMQLTAITEYMKTEKTCTVANLCNLLEVKGRRVRQLLKYFEEDGQIEIIGTYRNRRYKLK